MSLDPKSKPAEALRHDLLPAAAEVRQLSDLVVEIEPYYAPSIRAPRGRMLGFDVLVGDVGTKTVPALTTTAEIVPLRSYADFVPPGNDLDDEDIAF